MNIRTQARALLNHQAPKQLMLGGLALAFSIALGTGVTLGGADAGLGTTVYPPEGGVWTYGVYAGGEWGSQGVVRSDYKHPTKYHSATACAARNACTEIGWIAPGIYAYARYYPANYMGGNTAYYDVR